MVVGAGKLVLRKDAQEACNVEGKSNFHIAHDQRCCSMLLQNSCMQNRRRQLHPVILRDSSYLQRCDALSFTVSLRHKRESPHVYSKRIQSRLHTLAVICCCGVTLTPAARPQSRPEGAA